MFRAAVGPSSGDTTMFMRHLVLVLLQGRLSGMQLCTKLVYLQDYTEMHVQQNIKRKKNLTPLFKHVSPV
jgi:hypothetical protein